MLEVDATCVEKSHEIEKKNSIRARLDSDKRVRVSSRNFFYLKFQYDCIIS